MGEPRRLKAHAAAPHMAAYAAKTKDLIASRVIHVRRRRELTRPAMGASAAIAGWRRDAL